MKTSPGRYSLEPRCLGVEMFSAGGLEYTFDSFAQSLSSGPSLDVICF